VKNVRVRLAVCLLALCAVVLVISNHLNRNRPAVPNHRLEGIDRKGDVAQIKADFSHGAGRSARHGAAIPKHDVTPLFFREPETWFADNTGWMNPGNQLWQDFYIGPRIADKATIGGALDNFGIDGNSGTMPSIDWAGNILPVTGGNSGQNPFGGSYPGILSANGSSGAYAAPQTNSAANGTSVTANPPATANSAGAADAPSATTSLYESNTADGNGELVRSANRMEASLTNGGNGLLSTAAMDAVTNSYQAAGGMLLAQASPGKFNSGETGRQDLENRTVGRTDRLSSKPTPVVWISNLNGHTAQTPVDSGHQGPANPTIDQGWAPDQGWIPGGGSDVATAGDPWVDQSKTSVPWWQNLPIDNPAPHSSTDPVAQSTPSSQSSPDPTPQSALNPVPEPSQIVLMATVIALAALGAKRSAAKRRIVASLGGWGS
jgi:hypothetical protein